MSEENLKIQEEADLIMLEALVKSPAFSALKRALEQYRKECLSVLMSSSDTHKLYQTQGRMIGINIIENLPGLLVAQRQERLKREEEQKKKFQPKKPPRGNHV